MKLGGTISFNGTGSLVYLSRNRHAYYLSLSVHSGTCEFFGPDKYFNGRMTAVTSERKNILLGGGGVFSFGIFIRTADPHLIYDADTKVRINDSQSVLVGNHVWLGQDILVLKGTHIGSGSIVAGGSVMSGKRQPSNTVFGGSPARQIKEGVFFTGHSVHQWSEDTTEKLAVMDTDEWIYEKDNSNVDLRLIDQRISHCKSAEGKLKDVEELLVSSDKTPKNRFFLPAE